MEHHTQKGKLKLRFFESSLTQLGRGRARDRFTHYHRVLYRIAQRNNILTVYFLVKPISFSPCIRGTPVVQCHRPRDEHYLCRIRRRNRSKDY
jgi:hypothetical protein